MREEEKFRNLQKELTKDRGIGVAEIQTIYLGEIAHKLAIIADYLEMKGAENDLE